MQITIIAIGSRGDVQPYVALGLGFKDAGHEVRLATFAAFESLVRGHALDFAPLALTNGEPAPKTPERPGRTEKDEGPPWWVGRLKAAKSVAHRRLADCRDACEDAEAIVVSPMGTLLGCHLAEHLRVPLVRSYFAPSGSLLGYVRGPRFAPGWLNDSLSRASEGAARQALWQFARPWVNAARRDVLTLPPLPVRELHGRLNRQGVPLLYGYSTAVFAPADLGDWEQVTGYWFLDRPPDWEPPAALVEFLAAGPPPVYVGFGSVPFRNREATTAVVVEALSRAGQRGIILEASLPQGAALPRDVFAIDSVWHDWLFPRMTAAVHHGGAGTTAAALRAGLPSVILPAHDDQPFWASRVHALGVGPRPIPRRRLSVKRLAEAISLAANHANMRERAAALAEQIQSEDGVARAVEAFESYAVAAGRRRSAVTQPA